MSKIKDLHTQHCEELVAVLAKMSGYDFDFLYDRFQETMEENGDIATFVGITLDKDW